jgi:hypothetical protein
VVTEQGALIRELAIDPQRDKQPWKRPAADLSAATMT